MPQLSGTGGSCRDVRATLMPCPSGQLAKLLRKAYNVGRGCKHFAFFPELVHPELAHPEPSKMLRFFNRGMSPRSQQNSGLGRRADLSCRASFLTSCNFSSLQKSQALKGPFRLHVSSKSPTCSGDRHCSNGDNCPWT